MQDLEKRIFLGDRRWIDNCTSEEVVPVKETVKFIFITLVFLLAHGHMYKIYTKCIVKYMYR